MLGSERLRRMLHEISCDVTAARERDPAARGAGTLEILTSWAGVQAILAHRVAHAMHDAGVPMPRAAGSRSRAEATSAVTSLITRLSVPRPSTLRSLGSAGR